MKTSAAFAATLAAVATAQPRGHAHLHKHAARDIVTETDWVVVTEYVTQMVDATSTVWVSPGQAAETNTIKDGKGNFYETPSPQSQQPSSSAAPPPPPPPPPPAPAPTTTEAAKPPPPAPAPAPAAKAQPSSGGSSSASSGGSSSGSSSGSGSHKGDITYYQIGMGACGEDDSGKDDSVSIVALSHLLMGQQSNGNPYCGKTITIYGNGKSTTATVKDKCMGCKEDDIDVSEKVYKELWGGLGTGRMPVSWSFN